MDDHAPALPATPGSDAPPDELGLRLYALLRAADLATRAMARRLDLNLTDLAALNHLMADEPMGPVELAGLLDLSSASTTALADRLETAGHLVRRPHPTDRRRLVLEPTPHAQAEAWTALQPLLQGLASAGAGLDADERRVIGEWLVRATRAIAAFAADDPPGDGTG